MRLLLLSLAALGLSAGASSAQTALGTPQLGIEQTGACRQLKVRDLSTRVDVPIGCVDTTNHVFVPVGGGGSAPITSTAVTNALGYTPANKTGDTLAGLYSLTGTLTVPPQASPAVVDLWTAPQFDANQRGVWLSGSGTTTAPFSYQPHNARSGGELQRAQNLIKFKRSNQTTVPETALAIDALYDTGGTGMQGTMLALTTTLRNNPGSVWLSAADMQLDRGWSGALAVNHEMDVLNLSRDAFTPGNSAFIANLYLYGFAKYPGTEIISASVPLQAPAVGVPTAWQSGKAYVVDDFVGAPVVSNGGNYYFLQGGVSGGYSCTSGSTGPTGVEADTPNVSGNVADGGAGACIWQPYKAVFTNGVTGGAWHSGLAFRGGNLIQNDVLLDSTNAQTFINSDSRSKHSVAFIKDVTASPVSLNLAGTYSYSAINTNTASTANAMTMAQGQKINFKNTDASLYSAVGSNNFSFDMGGMRALTVIGNQVNGLSIAAAATGFGPVLATTGPDTNIPISFVARGNSNFAFGNGITGCSFTPAVGATSFSCPSDERLKRDITSAGPALPHVMDVRVRDYTVKATGDRKTGVIAQELRKTHPDLVHEDRDGMLSVDAPNPWLLVKAIQELKADNDNLRRRIVRLERRRAR